MATTMNLLQPDVRDAELGPRDRGHLRFPAGPGEDVWCAPHFGVRRLVAAMLVAGAVVALALGALELVVRPGGIPASAAGSSPASASQPAVLPAGVADRYYVVAPGDSLWSIARALAPHRDVRDYVDELKALNHGTALQPGQRIVLPG